MEAEKEDEEFQLLLNKQIINKPQRKNIKKQNFLLDFDQGLEEEDLLKERGHQGPQLACLEEENRAEQPGGAGQDAELVSQQQPQQTAPSMKNSRKPGANFNYFANQLDENIMNEELNSQQQGKFEPPKVPTGNSKSFQFFQPSGAQMSGTFPKMPQETSKNKMSFDFIKGPANNAGQEKAKPALAQTEAQPSKDCTDANEAS